MLYNFAADPDGHGTDASAAFSASDFNRLRRVKAAWDPNNMFRFNLNIPSTHLTC
ncbi:MAG TPA: BBE domain-containing protein [Streptosporangiaceae bacterium]|jgi:hypothetical protein